MSRIFPYPLLIASLVVMWLLLTDFTPGQFIVGCIVSLIAAQGLYRLHPAKPRLRRWDLLPKLIGIVLYDIIRSNIAVVKLIVTNAGKERKSGFLSIPLDLRDPTGLAILAVIITSTPGTAWLDYDSKQGTVLLHVFDLVDDTEWVELIKNRYEHLLLEIFE